VRRRSGESKMSERKGSIEKGRRKKKNLRKEVGGEGVVEKVRWLKGKGARRKKKNLRKEVR
jgi:hypothetical protein